jgi:hypothetical protein
MSGSSVAANRSAAGRGGRLGHAVVVVGLVLASAPAAIAQVAVQLQLQQMVAPQMQMIDPIGPQADGGGDAIGDPWWDEAEAKRPAAAPVAGEPEQVDEPEGPADAAEMARQHLQAQAEGFAQTLRQQALGVLRRELSLVRQTCPSLERQQRAIVLEAGRGAIDRSVEEQFQAVLGGRLRPGGAGRRPPGKPTDTEKAIRDAVLASAKANATDAEAAAYEAEHRLREERRKAAVVAALVAEVDREAYLDDAERQALGKTLTESYRDRWRPAVARLEQGMAVSDERNTPGLERCVEKALGKPRKAEWIAARDEARKLAGQAGMASHAIIEQDVPGVRRVIRREVRVNDKVLQLQVGVGVAEAEAPPPPAEDAPEEETK